MQQKVTKEAQVLNASRKARNVSLNLPLNKEFTSLKHTLML